MKAMVLHRPASIDSAPLALEELEVPVPRPGEVLVRVERCGVCRTDLHVVEGDLPPVGAMVIPGHEVVGTVARLGAGVSTLVEGDRVGVPWLHHTCGRCEFCLTGRENLCDNRRFTGYTDPGGYAEYTVGEEGYIFPLPPGDAAHWAPFLCAGIIGYRALKAALPRPGGRIGFFGFGAAAHLAIQVASRFGYETVAYSRNPSHLVLARELGATEVVTLADGTTDSPRPTLDGAVVFAPAGAVALQALRALKKGGCVSIASIHMTPIPSVDYDRYLFGERRLVSVEANTRSDALEFLRLAARLKLRSTVSERPLREANAALSDLKGGRVVGAVVLDCTAQ